MLENGGSPAHWLEVEPVGSAGNLEAIGARVVVRSGHRTQTQWVGDSDSARYGQGHYRLYFGLGVEARASAVTVHWPNGGATRLENVAADRIIRPSR
jgi:hypothetical protein